MGFSNLLDRAALWSFLLIGLATVTGCQVGPPPAVQRIISQRASIDFTGLRSVQNLDDLKATGAVPQNWEALPLQKTQLYAHRQWRSPSIGTGVGVAYIHLPIPVPASAILWFARHEYTRQKDDGRSLGEWTDAQGRQWFEAENNRFHVRGYAVTRGMDAWVVYCGYRRTRPIAPAEISLAARSVETIVPGAIAAPSQMAIAN